jgi:hypothetical protein
MLVDLRTFTGKGQYGRAMKTAETAANAAQFAPRQRSIVNRS